MFFELENFRVDTLLRALQLAPIPWAEINPILQTLLAQANDSKFQTLLSESSRKAPGADQTPGDQPT